MHAAATPLPVATNRPPPSPSYTETSETMDAIQIESDGGYLQIYYQGVHRDDKIELSEGLIIQAINTAIAQHEDTSLFPIIENGSIIIKDKWMCAQVTMSSYLQCTAFAKAYSELPIYEGDKVTLLNVEARQVDMSEVLGLNVATATSAPIRAKPKPAEDLLAMNGGWLEVRLTMIQVTAGITKEHVIKAVEAIGLETFRRRSVAGKVKDDSGEKLTLDDSFQTHKYNMIVKPYKCPLSDFPWAQYPMIPLTIPVRYKGQLKNFETGLQYQVGGRGLIDFDRPKDKHGRHYWKICNGPDGCKGPLSDCQPRCRQRERAHFHRNRLQQMAKEARKNNNISQQAAMKEAKDQRTAQARENRKRAMSMIIPKITTKDPCKYLAIGKCAAARNCKFDHTFLGSRTADGEPDWPFLANIECQLPRRQWGMCTRGSRCIYSCSLTDTHMDTVNSGDAGPSTDVDHE